MLKTRFAPSPSGFLHIGSVRTALFSFLHASHHQGSFVLRIEDTDEARSSKQSIDAILEGMQWLGLKWDEGPFYQSQRYDRYRDLANHLISEGKAYRCYCSKSDLTKLREEQIAQGKNPGYDGRCRDRIEPEPGIDPVIRFRTPDVGDVSVNDLVRGLVKIDNEMLDDLIIMRADGVPTFHFAVVVDDSDMGITHVIRGDDHLSNTAKHLHIIEALGFDRPQFAHLPMILGEDGVRLSKRHGALNVLDYRQQGFLPAAVLNYLARLGWSSGDQEIFSLEQLIKLFDVSDVNASAAKFDPDKLLWLNQQYILSSDPENLLPGLIDQFESLGMDIKNGPNPIDVIISFRERAQTLRDMAASAAYLYTDEIELEAAAAKKHLRPAVKEFLQIARDRFVNLELWEAEVIRKEVQSVAEQHEINFGKIGQPLRVAVTGGGVSPPIDLTLELVGQARSISRLDKALSYIEQRIASA
ncbi:MAG: glutamate--tRNA ligase [Pseudomonadota bacterium]|nr:glutamate--tRNA ligase [Pseudomonadota bacterium]